MWATPSNRKHIDVSFRAGGRWKVHFLIILKRAFAVIAQCLFVLEKGRLLHANFVERCRHGPIDPPGL